MTQILADYWAQLDGTIHPEDREVFRRFGPNGFNLDYPPPAFIGDVVNAPVIILNNNGGYSSKTALEFPDAAAKDEFCDTLSYPRKLDRHARSTAPYYLERNYSCWLISGEAALVNGVAYRSVDSKAPGVKSLSKKLPSAQLHQTWLRDSLRPLVERGERFVVIHRRGLWNGATAAIEHLPFTEESTKSSCRNEDLSPVEKAAVERFLRR